MSHAHAGGVEAAEPAGDAEAAITRATLAFRTLEHAGARRPTLLAYHPPARLNPFHDLLYRQAWARGTAPLPVETLAALEGLAPLARDGRRVVGHLHWTNPVLRRATDEADAARRVDTALATLDRFRAGGGRLAWTIHNVLPHETRFEAAEVRLRRGIVERADLVHVMAGRTADAVADRYPLDGARVVHVPHPAYDGALPELGTREAARVTLGIEPGVHATAFVGGIRPYKGLERLRTAWDALAAEAPGRRALIVAGEPGRGEALEPFLAWAATHPAVVAVPRALDDRELAVVLRAADAVVLPYERTLNSGVLLLAWTLGLPVVAPDEGAPAELVAGDAGRCFDPADADALLSAWRDVVELDPAAARAAARAIAAAHRPEVISDRLLDAFDEVLGS